MKIRITYEYAISMNGERLCKAIARGKDTYYYAYGSTFGEARKKLITELTTPLPELPEPEEVNIP